MTTRIEIIQDIGSANVGDGWKDSFKTTEAFVAILATKYMEKVKNFYPDAVIAVNINAINGDVINRGPHIKVETDILDDDHSIHNAVCFLIEDMESDVWGYFCASPDAFLL